MAKHFLTLSDRTPQELESLIERALQLKSRLRKGELYSPLANKTLALIFEKSSTRTRVSFEAAMSQLGGNSIFLSPDDSQLGRGEPIEDTSRVLSGMVDAVVVRTSSHSRIQTFAEYSTIPIINGLTDDFHPCQLLADVLTIVEKLGSVSGKIAAWIGDGNNVCHSWINAAKQFNFELRVCTPPGYAPNPKLIAQSNGNAKLVESPQLAADQSHIIVTDTWASMGQEDQKKQRLSAFEGYQVDQKLMARSQRDAIFMHCLPAYRGLEVAPEVIDGPKSVVWAQAENRLHAQKALLESLL